MKKMINKGFVLLTIALAWFGMVKADLAVSSYYRVSVSVADDCEGMGTTSGTKSVRENSKVTISAKANKGNAFAGWYDDYGDLVSWSASYTFRASTDVSYTARFVAAREDWLWVNGDDQEFGVGEYFYGNDNLYDYFSVESGSAPTIKVTGLPSGLKYDATTRTISGQATKRGVYYVTCSVQNGNGYKMSQIAIWNVGNASNGDYDDIGLCYNSIYENVFSDVSVGRGVLICELPEMTVTGLPPGLKFPTSGCIGGSCVCCPGEYLSGVPTKSGVYKVSFTEKKTRRRTVKTIAVGDGEPGYLDVVGDGWRGSASGSGVYAAGATVKLSAKPAKGYYFAGWYEDPDYEIPFSRLADWRKANDSFVFGSDMIGASLYARFVSEYEDCLFIDGSDSWNVNDEYSYDYSVESETLPMETVNGLPAGVKWNKEYRYFYVDDRLKLKPGTTIATITVKNLSGWTDTKTVRIVVPNLESWVFEGLDYSDNAYNFFVGTCASCCTYFGFEYDEDYKVTASGMPPGLKFVASYGWAMWTGTPTKAGTYTVTLTAKNGAYTEKATFTINVHPLPDYAVGTFNGVLRNYDDNAIIGSFTFTSAANGKQSIKVTTAEGTLSLSASSWNCVDEGVFSAWFSKSSQNEDVWFSINLTNDVEWNCDMHLEGDFSWEKKSRNGDINIEAYIGTAQRSPFAKPMGEGSYEAAYVAEELSWEYSTKKMAVFWDYDLEVYYLECADCVDTSEAEGLVTLKVNKNGTVTISGSLYYASSFSASTTLFFDTACGEGDTWMYGEHCYALFVPVIKFKMCSYGISGVGCETYPQVIPIYWFP